MNRKDKIESDISIKDGMLKANIKLDSKKFEPRATYQIKIEGGSFKNSHCKIVYDNDDIEHEVDQVLELVKTAILSDIARIKYEQDR